MGQTLFFSGGKQVLNLKNSFILLRLPKNYVVLACCWIDVSIAHSCHGDDNPVERVRDAEQRDNRCMVSTVNKIMKGEGDQILNR
jgi:hypothetical protein